MSTALPLPASRNTPVSGPVARWASSLLPALLFALLGILIASILPGFWGAYWKSLLLWGAVVKGFLDTAVFLFAKPLEGPFRGCFLWGWRGFTLVQIVPLCLLPLSLTHQELPRLLAWVWMAAMAGQAAATLRSAVLWGRESLGEAVPAASAALFLIISGQALLTVPHLTSLATTIGDEPFYLLNCESLLGDGDFNIVNNIANGSFKAFYWGEMTPEEGEGGWMVKVGLPLLLLPGYALGGRAGASTEMALLAGLLACQLFWLLKDLHLSWRLSLAAVWLLMTLTPLFPYSVQIFPEVPGALILVWCLRKFHRLWHRWSYREVAFGLLGSLLLPWLKIRFAPLTLVIGTAFFAAAWKQGRRNLCAAIPAAMVLGGGAFLAVDYWVFQGTIVWKRYFDAATPFNPWFGFRWLPEATGGLLFDQEFGLLLLSPFLLACLWGMRRTWKEQRPMFLAMGCAVAVLFYFLVVMRGYFWYGGYNPPGRFLTVILPLLALPLGFALKEWEGRPKGFFLAGGVLAALAMVLSTGWIEWRFPIVSGRNPALAWLEDQLSLPIAEWYPSWIRAHRLPEWQIWLEGVKGLFHAGTLAGGLGLLAGAVLLGLIFSPLTKTPSVTGPSSALFLLLALIFFQGSAIPYAATGRVEVEDLASHSSPPLPLSPSNLAARLRQDRTEDLAWERIWFYDFGLPWDNEPEDALKKMTVAEIFDRWKPQINQMMADSLLETQVLRPVGIRLESGKSLLLERLGDVGNRKLRIRARKPWEFWRPSRTGTLTVQQNGQPAGVLTVTSRLFQSLETGLLSHSHPLILTNSSGNLPLEFDWVETVPEDEATNPPDTPSLQQLRATETIRAFPPMTSNLTLPATGLLPVKGFFNHWPLGRLLMGPGVIGFEVDWPGGPGTVGWETMMVNGNSHRAVFKLLADSSLLGSREIFKGQWEVVSAPFDLPPGLHSFTLEAPAHRGITEAVAIGPVTLRAGSL